MTETTTPANEPDEFFNPFSAPQPGHPGVEPVSNPEPAEPEAVEEDPVDVMFQAPDLSQIAAKKSRQQDQPKQQDHSDEDEDTDDDGGDQGGGRSHS